MRRLAGLGIIVIKRAGTFGIQTSRINTLPPEPLIEGAPPFSFFSYLMAVSWLPLAIITYILHLFYLGPNLLL